MEKGEAGHQKQLKSSKKSKEEAPVKQK